MSQGTKFPKLLPKDEHYTKLIVEDFHRQAFHAGVSQTLSHLRSEYWIPQGISVVRKLLKQCQACGRYEGGAYSLPKMPPWPKNKWWPKERVVEALPFEHTELDYFGPLYIKRYTDSNKPVYKKCGYMFIYLYGSESCTFIASRGHVCYAYVVLWLVVVFHDK